jgi:hypothetical protein
MTDDHLLGIVPSQHTGKEIRSESNKIFNTQSDAEAFFKVATKRLRDVNNWNKISGVITAQFRIVDEKGREVNREVRANDFLRIDIPGPGSKEGDGYDWVRVEELKEVNEGSVQSIGFRVRPTDNPFSEKNETAHFYSHEATSSFIITRDNNKITSLIIDRNLQPNKESGSLVNKVRDVVVGVSAIAGFSKIQWDGLADGLLADA